jgi:Peptidase_C39 like family
MRKNLIGVLAVPLLIVIAIGIYFIPPIHARVSPHIDDLSAQINSYFHPPDQAVFQPQQSQQNAISAIVNATMQAYVASQTPTATAVPISGSPTAAPTITPTPLPSSMNLPGVVYVDQSGGWNLCGPTNLYMALKFWSWTGSRDDIIKVVKPGINDPKLTFIQRGETDKNVMPYELVDFVQNDTAFHSLYRYGGDINLLKSLIASGFPVLVEKQVYERSITDGPGQTSWLGHYAFVTGYDDSLGVFFYQDTYPPAGVDGKNRPISYSDFQTAWRAFDYIFIVVYPADREQDVFNLIGPWSDTQWSNQHALDIANQEIKTLSGLDLYLAWFNRGTSDVQLLQYNDAATAYDQAFALYPSLPIPASQRPYRMMWYQTGPYWAYYYTDRYQDVINLANTTLSTVLNGPTLEESIYWRGMAEQATGDMTDAVTDFKRADHLNPNMQAAIQALQSLGVTPEKPVK